VNLYSTLLWTHLRYCTGSWDLTRAHPAFIR